MAVSRCELSMAIIIKRLWRVEILSFWHFNNNFEAFLCSKSLRLQGHKWERSWLGKGNVDYVV